MDAHLITILTDIKEAQGRIEAKVDALSGPEGRVTKIENAQTRQWWISSLSAAAAPVLVGVHAIARKFGAQI
jgi:hypothetical protein